MLICLWSILHEGIVVFQDFVISVFQGFDRLRVSGLQSSPYLGVSAVSVFLGFVVSVFQGISHLRVSGLRFGSLCIWLCLCFCCALHFALQNYFFFLTYTSAKNMLFNIFSKQTSFSSETIRLKCLLFSTLHYFTSISFDLS